MYLDSGDELLPGQSLENYARFEALQVHAHMLYHSVTSAGYGRIHA